MVISNSDRVMFKNCRRKWDLNSPNRQNYRSRAKQRPLWLGSLVHECLEGFYGELYPDTYKAFLVAARNISKEEREEYAEQLEMTEVLMKHYSLIYPSLECEPFTVIAVELPFQIPLNNTGDVFAGTIDGVIRFKDSGQVGILEHKTFSMQKDVKLHGIDDQTSIYPPALNMLIKQGLVPGTTKDDFCTSILYNGIWKKLPTEIKFLKNGSVSKISETNMTFQWLEHSLKMLGKNPRIAIDKQDELMHNVEKFFPRWLIHRGEKEQKLAVNRLLEEVKEMTNPNVALYHNPTTECPWKCPFLNNGICEGINRGADVQLLIETFCEKSPSRGEAYEKKGDK